MTQSTYRGIGYALFSALMSACFLLPWKLATHHGDADVATLVLLATAALLSSVTFVLPAARGLRAAPASRATTLRLALALAALSLAGNWFSAEAVHRISGALLAVMQRCEVLVVGLLGAAVIGERVRPSFWLGTLLAGAGLVLLSQSGAHAGAQAQHDELIGALCGLGSATCFGAMAVLTRKYIAGMRPVLLNATRLWLGVVLWFLVQRRWPQLNASLVLYAALAAFFGPFLSRLGAMYSARHVTASTTALAALVTPSLTLVLSWLVLGTLPTGRELSGGAVMLTGVAIPVVDLLRAERQKPAHARAS